MFTTNDNERSLGELERNAERDRAALMDTVDALQKRISPSAIKHDVQDYVRTRTDSFAQGLEQKARDNPLQAVAIAAGAAYPLWSIVTRIPVPLLLIGAGFALARRSAGGGESAGQGFVNEARDRLGQATDAVRAKFDDVSEAVQQQAQEGMASARRAADRLSGLKSEISQRADDLTTRVGERVSETAGTVRGMSSEAVSRASDMMSADRMQRAGTQATGWIDDTISRNPLIVGAVGLAIGAVIAAALPATRQEDEFLGPTADDVKQRARDAALEGVEAAKGVAKEIYSETARHAKEEGLSAEGLKEAAGQVAGKVRTAVAGATGSQSQTQDTDNAPSQTNNSAG